MLQRYPYRDPPGFYPLYSQADANQAWAAGLAEQQQKMYTTLDQLVSSVNVTGSSPVSDPIPGKEDDVPMESLYEVFVVSKARKLILHEYAVAKDEAGAQFRAGVDGKLREAGLEPDDVTILCLFQGGVEVERKPQRMKIVEE